MATNEETWEVGGRYGNIGVEILAGSHVIAVVNRVQDARLRSLRAHPTADDPQQQRARDVAQLEGSLPLALERARLMAAAPDLLAACREVVGYLPLWGPRSDIKMLLMAAIAKAEGRPPEGTPNA